MGTEKICQRRVLFEDNAVRVISNRYAPGSIFTPHYDSVSRITLTLAGAVAEDVSHHSVTVTAGDILLKSSHTLHENRYSAMGARHVTIEALQGKADTHDNSIAGIIDSIGWQRQQGPEALQHTATVVDAALSGSRTMLHTTISDICTAIQTSRRRPVPPAWLRLLKAELQETGFVSGDLAHYAKTAGVHPAHISRLFRQCFGMSITLFTQSHTVQRALQLLCTDYSLADVAATAGFYDQSHMGRVFRRCTGFTPGDYKRLWQQARC